MPPPLSQVLAVIEGQTKMQLVKILKKTTIKHFVRLLLMPLEGEFLIQLHSLKFCVSA